MKITTKNEIFYISAIDGKLHSCGKVVKVSSTIVTTENGTKFHNYVKNGRISPLGGNSVGKYIVK